MRDCSSGQGRKRSSPATDYISRQGACTDPRPPRRRIGDPGTPHPRTLTACQVGTSFASGPYSPSPRYQRVHMQIILEISHSVCPPGKPSPSQPGMSALSLEAASRVITTSHRASAKRDRPTPPGAVPCARTASRAACRTRCTPVDQCNDSGCDDLQRFALPGASLGY